ncbi:hypothetical protein P154DRAFT_559129 [Amniculicola lignicola CBS 123094]|uniref:Uncharacterized protein n=1 Tax=Amniculicola lignicola CBS 123094 TaxID=1392246 RepID=A0A6A5WYB6_9PLEO|nr:hypothetical protein P154DRAFT_559129 [Amniculicola lignicola CBS 123094]
MVSYDPYTAQKTAQSPSMAPKTPESALEKEQAQIASYEEGWDSWDGPIWPVGTVQCDLQEPTLTLKPLNTFEHMAEEFERQKASLTSYEEGWDSWDGPIWPQGTVQCDLLSTEEPELILKPLNTTEHLTEEFEREKAAITSYEEGWDSWDGPVWPIGTVQCDLQEEVVVQKKKE